jgi:hypothetical protein
MKHLTFTLIILSILSCESVKEEKADREKTDMEKALDVSNNIKDAFDSMDDDISAGTKSIKRRGDEAYNELQSISNDSETNYLLFDRQYAYLKEYIDTNKYKIEIHEGVPINLPYLSFGSMVSKNYIIKEKGKVKIIIKSLRMDTDSSIGAIKAKHEIRNLKKDNPDFYKKLSLNINGFGVLSDSELILIQYAPQILKDHPELLKKVIQYFQINLLEPTKKT